MQQDPCVFYSSLEHALDTIDASHSRQDPQASRIDDSSANE